MTTGGSSRPLLGPPIPRQAPPFPPLELLVRRRRITGALILVAGIVASFALYHATRRYEPPPARATTGLPLPGLAAEPGDEEWASAPERAFTVLEWSLLKGITMSETSQALVRVPDSVSALGGMAVRVTGFMVPLDIGPTTLDFVLVPDMARCWFCDTPDPARSIYARGAFGPVESIVDRPVVAWGLLDVGVLAPGEKFHSALRLRVVRVDRL